MRRRSRLPYLITIPIVLAGLIVAAKRDLLWPPATVLTQIPAEVETLHPEIKFAEERYHANGGRYIWGANDCSIFVADYIKACGKPVSTRPTTETMMWELEMRRMGFASTRESTKPGDILVYRYRNSEGEWRGHAGVVVWYRAHLWVAHNAASFNGLVLQDYKNFRDLMERITRKDESLQRKYRRIDFDSWYADFLARRERLH